jgi:hypothetical protein
LILLLVLLLLPTIVRAAPSIGTFIGLGPHDEIRGTLPDGSSFSNDGGAMKFDAGPKDGAHILATFCIDIHHTVRSGDAYHYEDELSDWRLIYLIQTYPPLLNGDATEMAARQAAVWYVSDGFEPNTDPSDAVAVRAWEIINEVESMSEEDYNDIELPHLSLTPENVTLPHAPTSSQSYTLTLLQGQTGVSGKDIVVTTDSGILEDVNGTQSTSALTLTTSITGFTTFRLLPPPGQDPVTTTLTATAEAMSFPAGAVYLHESGAQGQKLILGENTVQDLSVEATITWEDPNAVALSGLKGGTNRIAGFGGLGVGLLLGIAAITRAPKRKPR